jgi:hypothetical protein
MVHTKVIVLNIVYNFVVEKFLNLKLFKVPNLCSKFIDFKFSNLEFLNDVECSHT